jgi:FKBP-type peptidyl-prolyl cis-trans isomerase FklB
MRFIFCLVLTGLLMLPVMGQKGKQSDKGKKNQPVQPVQTPALATQMDSVSYSLGVMMATSIKKAGISGYDEKIFMQAISDVNKGGQTTISADQANMVLNMYFSKLMEMKADSNRIAGEKFLQENALKEGVVKLPSGLQYKVIKAGTGAFPTDSSTVTVHYTGTFVDGKVFDSSVQRGEPIQIPVNGVIPGWTEALKLMQPGAKWMLYIPSELGYGDRAPEEIGPNKVLIFEVELLSID